MEEEKEEKEKREFVAVLQEILIRRKVDVVRIIKEKRRQDGRNSKDERNHLYWFEKDDENMVSMGVLPLVSLVFIDSFSLPLFFFVLISK